jgi:protein-tyrosine phosphatase
MTLPLFLWRSALVPTALGAALLTGCAGPKPLADACRVPLSPVIANSCQVTPGVLWRGAKPDASGAAALIELGVQTVVNLELLHDDRSAFEAAHPTTPEATNISYFRIRDWEPNVIVAPDLLDDHVAQFLAIVRTQPRPIYVHCRSGQNRTGVMVAAYRVLVEGVSVDAALAEMQRYQGVWFKQDAQYLRSLSSERRTAIEAMAQNHLKAMKPDARLACTSVGCLERP